MQADADSTAAGNDWSKTSHDRLNMQLMTGQNRSLTVREIQPIILTGLITANRTGVYQLRFGYFGHQSGPATVNDRS